MTSLSNPLGPIHRVLCIHRFVIILSGASAGEKLTDVDCSVKRSDQSKWWCDCNELALDPRWLSGEMGLHSSTFAYSSTCNLTRRSSGGKTSEKGKPNSFISRSKTCEIAAGISPSREFVSSLWLGGSSCPVDGTHSIQERPYSSRDVLISCAPPYQRLFPHHRGDIRRGANGIDQ